MMSSRQLHYSVKIIGLDEGSYAAPFSFSCKKLKHADPCLGYRLEVENKIITYCSDTAVCSNDEWLAREADVLIHECAYRPGFSSDWGHTNPEQAATLAKKIHAKRLILTHFGANDYPTFTSRRIAQHIARRIFKKTIAARDGLRIKL